MSNAAIKALETMELRDTDQWVRDNPAVFDVIMKQALYWPSLALPDPDNPAVVCGIVVIGEGEGELWMVVGKDFVGRTAVTVVRQLRSLFISAMQVFNLKNLRLCIRPSRDGLREWARHLGFRFDHAEPNGGMLGEGIEVWMFSKKEGVKWK